MPLSSDPYAAFYRRPTPSESILEHIERVRAILRPAFDVFGNRATYNLFDNLSHGIYLLESLPNIQPWINIKGILLDNFDIHMARLARTYPAALRMEDLPLWIEFDTMIFFLVHREGMLCPVDYIRYESLPRQ